MKLTIALVILALMAVAFYAPFWLRAQRRKDAREFDRAAQWEMYSHPVGPGFKSYEVGARIELSRGEYKFPIKRWDNAHPVWDNRTSAEGDAIAKAEEFNQSNWRPDVHV